MGDHFHNSLQELRQQLDLMNSRTASILNKSRQHNNMLTHDSSTVGQPPSVTTDNMQQIKHIGATVGTLAKQQEDRFQKLEHQLDLLTDQLDDLAPASLITSTTRSPNPSRSQLSLVPQLPRPSRVLQLQSHPTSVHQAMLARDLKSVTYAKECVCPLLRRKYKLCRMRPITASRISTAALGELACKKYRSNSTILLGKKRPSPRGTLLKIQFADKA
jgi:DNA-binding HxlR family transcriptional regulator